MSAVLDTQSNPLLRSTMDSRSSPGFDSRFGRILLISLVVHLFILIIIKVDMDFVGGSAGPLEITLVPTIEDVTWSRHPVLKNSLSRPKLEDGPVLGRDIQTMIQEYFRAEDTRQRKNHRNRRY